MARADAVVGCILGTVVGDARWLFLRRYDHRESSQKASDDEFNGIGIQFRHINYCRIDWSGNWRLFSYLLSLAKS